MINFGNHSSFNIINYTPIHTLIFSYIFTLYFKYMLSKLLGTNLFEICYLIIFVSATLVYIGVNKSVSVLI